MAHCDRANSGTEIAGRTALLCDDIKDIRIVLFRAIKGALNALWPICLVIVAALYTYVLTLEIG